MRNKFRRKKFLVIAVCVLVIAISIVAVVICLRYLQNNASNNLKEQRIIEMLQEQKQQAEESEKTTETMLPNVVTTQYAETNINEPQILKVYKSFYDENEDLYGWISINDTAINYPVMFTPYEPDFYIDKNWDKEICERNVGTSIWIDGRTLESSKNVIIYGHYMSSGQGFTPLKEYKKESYYKDHEYIEFDTLYEKRIYEIIAVVKTQDYGEDNTTNYQFYDHIELDSEEEFQEYIDNAKLNAYYNIEATAEWGDSLITLSTCDYWTTDARLLIIAKRID